MKVWSLTGVIQYLSTVPACTHSLQGCYLNTFKYLTVTCDQKVNILARKLTFLHFSKPGRNLSLVSVLIFVIDLVITLWKMPCVDF